MPYGPCGAEFRDTFVCFQKSVASDANDKIFDCAESAVTWQKCLKQYPDLYGHYMEKKEDDQNKNEMTMNQKEASSDTNNDTHTSSEDAKIDAL